MTQLEDPAEPLVEIASRDNPEAYIPRDRRRALAAGVELPDRVLGAALFADISGFTPLTEALANELGPQRGAEELTANLGRVFHAVIDELDRRGGDVIYFSGDAITCWIDRDDGLRATAAALAMHQAIERVGRIVTPGGTTVSLRMKVAVAVGEARRFVVGDPDIQLIDVLAGRLIDDLAEAEHYAERGEVVLEASAVRSLGARVRLREERPNDGGRGPVGVVDDLLVDVGEQPVVEPPPLPDEQVRPWLLPPVWERLRTGRGEFLAELRPAYPVFLRFGGIDYDDDEDAIAKLDDFVRKAQRVFAAYGGNVLQLTLGDKGAYLYGVFGSPIAHEDDAGRAAATALELRELDRTTQARDIQIGVSHGRLRSGTYGHAMRRTFVCLGDAVNLSARLMSKAPTGAIYASDAVRQAAPDTFLWERLPDLTLKGKAQPVVAHALTGSLERASRRRLRFELPLAGRLEELAFLENRLRTSAAGDGHVVGLSAEAGMGKSRLVAEFVRSVRRSGVTVAFGECQAYGSATAYVPWRDIWLRLFDVDAAVPPERQLEALQATIAALDPELVPRVPLLGAVLGMDIPDTELTASFDAKLRKTSLEDFLVRSLRAITRDRALVVVIEDGHWIDELSRDLLLALTRAASTLPVLFLLAYRPAGSTGGGLGVERLSWFEEITLGELGPQDAARVIRAKLEQLLGADAEPPGALVGLVTERSQGNPFYIEELVNYVAGQGIDLADPAAISAVELPESLHSLVLSRIDTVAEKPRRTLKVASVIGRVFRAAALPEVYPELGELDVVRTDLGALSTADLVRLDRDEDESYLFKHVVTQEVAYGSLPFAVRATLHGLVGRYLERAEAETLDQHLDLLAYHYWQSDDAAKKVEYLGRAADAARDAYANTAAIDYYERLIPLLEPPDGVAALLKLAKVLQVVGELGRAESTALDARALAAEHGDRLQVGWADASVAETAKRQSRFEEASKRADGALDTFRALGVDAGVGDMLHLGGVIAQLQGDYRTAGECYQESRWVREGILDWAGVATTDGNLAILAEFDGDFAAALEINDRSLALRRRLGDPRGTGIGEMNAGYYRILTGDLEGAREHLHEALRISRELGDRQMIAHATFTLGNAERDLGDHTAAAARYGEALRLQRDLDDRFSLTFIVEDVGVLLARAGEPEQGFELLGGAESIRELIGSPRPSTLETELAGHFASPRHTLGDAAADAAVARGRAWSFEHALDTALAGAARIVG